jgi:hypothetical protein
LQSGFFVVLPNLMHVYRVSKKKVFLKNGTNFLHEFPFTRLFFSKTYARVKDFSHFSEIQAED